MMVLQISEELAGAIQREAQNRGLSVEEYLYGAIRRERTLTERQQIEQEQEWWFSLPLSKRADYEGQSVAIYHRQLVDHDKDEKALYRRIRKKYGNTPVLIIPAEGPREIRVFSPRLIRS
jgi:hypothetical protein